MRHKHLHPNSVCTRFCFCRLSDCLLTRLETAERNCAPRGPTRGGIRLDTCAPLCARRCTGRQMCTQDRPQRAGARTALRDGSAGTSCSCAKGLTRVAYTGIATTCKQRQQSEPSASHSASSRAFNSFIRHAWLGGMDKKSGGLMRMHDSTWEGGSEG